MDGIEHNDLVVTLLPVGHQLRLIMSICTDFSSYFVTKTRWFSSVVEHLTCNQKVRRSIRRSSFLSTIEQLCIVAFAIASFWSWSTIFRVFHADSGSFST